MKALLATLLCALGFTAGAAVQSVPGGGGGSATNAQPPSGVLTNLANNPFTGYTNLPINKTVFVDGANGNDSTAVRGDAMRPFLTLSNGFNALQSGDALWARPGIYFERPAQTNYAGTLKIQDKASIRLYMNGVVITNSGLGPTFLFSNAQNIYVEGVTLMSPAKTNGNLVGVYPAFSLNGPMRDIEVNSITISNFADNGFTHLDQGQWTGGWKVRNSKFYNHGNTNNAPATFDGTAIGVLVPDTLIENNLFVGNFRDIEGYTVSGTQPQFIRNVIIRNNTSSNAMQHFYCNFHTNSTEVLLDGNHLYHDGGHTWSTPIAMLLGANFGATISGNTIAGWPLAIVDSGGSTQTNMHLSVVNNLIRDGNTALQLYSTAGGAPRFTAIHGNAIHRMNNYGIDVGLDRGSILGNRVVDSGISGGAGIAISLHRAGAGFVAGTNTSVLNNHIFNSGAVDYTDGSVTIGASAVGTFVAGNILGPGVGAVNDSGVGTLGNDYVIHRGGIVTNIVIVLAHGQGTLQWESAGDIMFLNSDFDSPIDSILFGQSAYIDPAPKLERNGSGIRFKDALDDSWANIEASSVRAASKSHVTNEMVAQAFSARVTNLTAIASGRYTNDANTLLDGIVLFSLADPSATVKRTNMLPSAATFPGREITVLDGSKTASASNVFITTVSGQTINGGPTITNITADNGSMTLLSDGANWRIKAAFP